MYTFSSPAALRAHPRAGLRCTFFALAFCLIGANPRAGAQEKRIPSVEITVEEAAASIGHVMIVEGVVAEVSQGTRGHLYLNFGGKFPNQTFSVQIPSTGMDGKPLEHWIHRFQGKRVIVDGRIFKVKDKPQMEMERAFKVKVVDEKK